ncbi:MAG: homoserine O-acetyltransferase [Pseudomonadota bacterium]
MTHRSQHSEKHTEEPPADHPSQAFMLAEPLALDGGQTLAGVKIAYETWGTLNDRGTNAILVCHALTGDQFAAGAHPVSGKPGWWDHMIGPGKPINTDRYFVICSNILGGCMGTTGPASRNPADGTIYGLTFPVLTIADMVRAQERLITHLGIDQLLAVIGGSMGGMQVLEWAVRYPERVRAAAPIATAARHSPQNIAFHEVGRQAVMADPHWHMGNYHDTEESPAKGLAVARMAAHITYLSEAALNRKFGRGLQDRPEITFGFDADFQVESYLRHQGMTFVDRFDANAYLYITRAMDYFDLAARAGGRLADAFKAVNVRFLLTSFTSDWLYPTAESRAIVRALHAAGNDVSFVEIDSDKGHDAFLLPEPAFDEVLIGFLDSVARDAGAQ